MLVTASNYFTEEHIRNTVVGQGQHHSFESELRASGYDVRTLPWVGGSRAGALELRKLVRDLGVDVIHIHTEGNYLRTALVSRWALGRKGAIIRTIHNVFQATGSWRVKRFIQAYLADRLMYALIAPSPEVAENERKISRKARVIFNWVDDIFFEIREQRAELQNSRDSEAVAVIVGNCSKIKHHELALKALVESDHRLIHLGNEDDASPEELQMLRFLEVEGRLIDRGVKPPHEALLRASYFMMPSRHEGMGVALAEALVAGLPALVNDAPGLQWARQIEGASMLNGSDAAWTSAVQAWRDGRGWFGSSTLDFSAARGAREYAEVYRKAVSPSQMTEEIFRKET